MTRNFTLEKDLIDQLRSNDTAAFEELYNRYWFSLYSYCIKKLESPDAAKQIVIDIFIDLWEKREKFPADFSMSGYLYNAIRTSVVNHLNTGTIADPEGKGWTEEKLLASFSNESLQQASTPVNIEGWQKHTIPLPERSVQKKKSHLPLPNISQLKWLLHLNPLKS